MKRLVRKASQWMSYAFTYAHGLLGVLATISAPIWAWVPAVSLALASTLLSHSGQYDTSILVGLAALPFLLLTLIKSNLLLVAASISSAILALTMDYIARANSRLEILVEPA